MKLVSHHGVFKLLPADLLSCLLLVEHAALFLYFKVMWLLCPFHWLGELLLGCRTPGYLAGPWAHLAAVMAVGGTARLLKGGCGEDPGLLGVLGIFCSSASLQASREAVGPASMAGTQAALLRRVPQALSRGPVMLCSCRALRDHESGKGRRMCFRGVCIVFRF